MITFYKGDTGNTIATTFSERLNNYNIQLITGATFYFKLINDSTRNITEFSASDMSNAPFRYNQFMIDETALNLATGQYTYYGYADSAYTQSLEVGRLIVSGASTDNIYS
jgi:hypothetical protein